MPASCPCFGQLGYLLLGTASVSEDDHFLSQVGQVSFASSCSGMTASFHKWELGRGQPEVLDGLIFR
jgi:hypothetical protein